MGLAATEGPWWLSLLIALITTIPGLLTFYQSRKNHSKLRQVNHAVRDQAQATTSLADELRNFRNGH